MLTLVHDLGVSLVPDYLGLGPGVPRPAAQLPLRARVEGERRVGVNQLQLGRRHCNMRA